MTDSGIESFCMVADLYEGLARLLKCWAILALSSDCMHKRDDPTRKFMRTNSAKRALLLLYKSANQIACDLEHSQTRLPKN